MVAKVAGSLRFVGRRGCVTAILVVALVGRYGFGRDPVSQVPTYPVYRTQSPDTMLSGGGTQVSGPLGMPGDTLPDPLAGPDLPTPRGPVLGVAIVGNKTVKEAEIRRHIKTRKDRAFDPQLVKEDLRRLFATRKFHNVRVQKKVVAQGVYVTFEVLERPMIGDVLFIGNQHYSDKKLLKEAGLSKGEALNIYTVQEARRKVEEFYQSKGLAKTRILVVEGDKPSDNRIVLRVEEGPIERIWAVRFIGNDPRLATDARLKTQIKSKPGFLKYLFRGKVDFTAIEEDRQRLVAYYRGLGYFQARVSRELEYDKSGQWLTLNFVIDEGSRYKIRELKVVGNQKFAGDQLLNQLDLQAGEFFNLEEMQRDENTLRELYGSSGHIFADIKASPRFLEEPGQLDLVYQVEEGELFRVGMINIHVEGESPSTRKSVILNRLSLRPGDIIDIREVRASERRLKASQLFIANPAEGTPPRIVIRPPNLEEAATLAEKSKPSYRGQSPDNVEPRKSSRPMVLDVFLPPLKRE